MEKEWVKPLVRLLAASREYIPSILSGLDEQRGDRGIFRVPEEMVNDGWRAVVMDMARGKLEDYRVSFREDGIHVEATLKVMLKTRLHMVLHVEDFVFGPKGHYGVVRYETVGSSLAHTFLPKVLDSMVKKAPDLVRLDGNRLFWSLESIPEIPSWLAVKYRGTKDGVLEAAFLMV
jgi:hypothetical protein